MIDLPDSAIAVPWFGATLLLGASGVLAARRFFPGEPGLQQIGHVIVICWAQLVVVATALGAVGLLLPAGLLAGVSGSATLTLVLVVRLGQQMKYWPRTPSSDQTPFLTRWAWPAVWSILFAFWAGHVVTGSLLRFPDDFDTLMYHLPLVDHWLQARSLYAPDGLRWSDPGNNELITLWFVAPFSGDFLNSLTNLPSAILLASGALELGRQIGLSTAWQNLASLAVVSNFVVFKQLIDVENDVAVAALFIASLAYGLRYSDRRRPADLLLGVIGLGLLAGVKYYALGYVSVAAAGIGLLILRRMGWRALLRASASGLVGIAVFGGYWYARNWLAAGSPFYPLGAPSENADLAWKYPNVWQTTFVGNGQPELLRLSVEAVRDMTGPCHLAAFLGFPIIVLWLIGSGFLQYRRSRTSAKGVARLALTAVTLGAGLVLVVTPFAVEDVPDTLNQMHWKYCPVRYGLCFLSVTLIGLARVLDDWSRGVRATALALLGVLLSARAVRIAGAVAGAIIPVLFAVGIAHQLIAVPRDQFAVEAIDSLLIGVNVLLVVGLLRLVMMAYRRPKWVSLMLVCLMAIGFSVGTGQLSERWHRGYAPFYDRMLGGGFFDHMARTESAGTAVCVFDMRAYPFFGSARQFRVCQPGGMPSYEWWQLYLRERDVSLIAAHFDQGETYRGWWKAGIWMIERPRMFVGVNGQRWTYAVYRVASENE